MADAKIGDGRVHPLREYAGEAYAALAFGLAAGVYSFFTNCEIWHASCRQIASLVPGPRVLDLGVGPGTSALASPPLEPNARHLGLDLSPDMLRRARRAASLRGDYLPLVQADAQALPFRDGALDGVTLHSLLYLLERPRFALAEARRVLRPGGRIALLEPHAGPLPLRDLARLPVRSALCMLLWRSMSRLHRRFEEAELEQLVSEAGFANVRAWPVLCAVGVMAVGEAS